MKESEVQINRVDWIAVSIYFALVMIRCTPSGRRMNLQDRIAFSGALNRPEKSGAAFAAAGCPAMRRAEARIGIVIGTQPFRRMHGYVAGRLQP